jgi:eukaryotic-like serine/threonine-protein kinase
LITGTRTPIDLLQGELAPEFRPLRRIGDGAVALVYLVAETALERLVALKVLRQEIAVDDVVRRRFTREAQAAARIVHPNVVVVHRVGELRCGLPYLIMEYVEGRTLEDLLASQGAMEMDGAIELLTQLASALAAAHEKRIIHRDVRPGNVLIEDGTSRAVLTDFGIAGIRETGSEVVTRLTRASEVLGDPRYASPEQLLGEPVTEAADVYSFGVLGYEILARAGPFTADSPRALVAAHLQQTPRGLREVRADVPAEAALLVERCLAKKPEHRPRAADVAAALAALAATRKASSHGGEAPAADDEPPFFPALASFLGELRRRRVYRAAATYLAATFVALQGADIVFPALSVAAWVLPALVIAAAAGFPVVLVLTWIFDINRGGIERTPDPELTLLAGERIARRTVQIVSLVLTVFAAALFGWWMLR